MTVLQLKVKGKGQISALCPRLDTENTPMQKLSIHLLVSQNQVMSFFVLLLFILLFSLKGLGENGQNPVPRNSDEWTYPSQIIVKGFLGQAIHASEQGRLTELPGWKEGELIKMFSIESREKSDKNDWYGEHAGKWLYTTAIAAERTNDEKLKSLLLRTADYLIGTQENDGYLGTYSPARRITNRYATTHATSWDVWNLSYMVLGLLEVNKYFPDAKYRNAALKTGELFLKTFGEGKADITGYGTRKGMSATILLEPVVELFNLTGDNRFLDFAEWIVRKMEEKEGFRIISESLKKTDSENIGDGKAYQLIWNYAAIAKLYQITKNSDYLKAVENGWQNIAYYHLTESGGPWGGIGKHLECFNRRGFWSPYGFVETCSIMAWIQLNRELLRITGHPRYAQAIEQAAYNALPGAQFPGGSDWCYHSFSNGSRHIAHFNDCCPSSGALALEELPQLIYSVRENGIACNLYSAGEASVSLPDAGVVRIIQETDYPFDGKIRIILSPESPSGFPLFIRIPDWASSASIRINGNLENSNRINSGTYYAVRRKWTKGDRVEIDFPFELNVSNKKEYTNAPQGGKAIYSTEWFSLSRGPLVFACNGLIYGTDREKTFSLPESNRESCFTPVSAPPGFHGPAYEFKIPGEAPLLFLPYYEAGGRTPGSWRLTWLQNKVE